MPQVKVDGKAKKFAYTPEGMDKAKRMALRTGGKLKKRKKTVGTRPDTLLNTYKKTLKRHEYITSDPSKRGTRVPTGAKVLQHPVTGLDYMKVPELEYDRKQRLKKEERMKYKAGAKKRADALRAKNPDAHHWKKKN
jgi:hypothetical protein